MVVALMVSEVPEGNFCGHFWAICCWATGATRRCWAILVFRAKQSSYYILVQALVVSEGPKAIFCEFLGSAAGAWLGNSRQV